MNKYVSIKQAADRLGLTPNGIRWYLENNPDIETRQEFKKGRKPFVVLNFEHLSKVVRWFSADQ